VNHEDVLYQQSSQSETPVSGHVDRRKSVRYAISATAEVVDLRTRTRVAGRATDLGPNGCYVDSMSPFSVGSCVGVRLACEEHSFYGKADVIYAHPGMGMGLLFTDLAPDQNQILDEWILTLSGKADLPMPFAPSNNPGAEKQVGEQSGSPLFNAVTGLLNALERKGLLDSAEIRLLRDKLTG